MRAIWKGHIQFSLVTIPIKLYSAIESSAKVSFNQLHEEDYGRVGYVKQCKKCKQPLATDDIVKGYEYEPDHYVIVENEDLEKLKFKSIRVIEIEGFVEVEDVDPTLFDTPYYIGPDGPVASKTYALLVETLKDSGKMGVGRVVLRDRESAVLMAPKGPGLLMYKLRYPQELRDMGDVPLVDGAEADQAQLELARTLVNTMSVKLDDLDLRDRYNDALMELIEAKAAGKELVAVAEEEKEVVDIMTALQTSIEQAKSARKPMKKADGSAEKETKGESKARKTA